MNKRTNTRTEALEQHREEEDDEWHTITTRPEEMGGRCGLVGVRRREQDKDKDNNNKRKNQRNDWQGHLGSRSGPALVGLADFAILPTAAFILDATDSFIGYHLPLFLPPLFIASPVRYHFFVALGLHASRPTSLLLLYTSLILSPTQLTVSRSLYFIFCYHLRWLTSIFPRHR
jgi:hypothetical protein